MAAYSSRTTEFGYGATGSEASPIGIQRTSVLMGYMKSANGMGAKDAARQTPYGEMPTSNGSALNTYSQLFPTGLETRAY